MFTTTGAVKPLIVSSIRSVRNVFTENAVPGKALSASRIFAAAVAATSPLTSFRSTSNSLECVP
jgi:hypothetical protein